MFAIFPTIDMRDWIGKMSDADRSYVLNALTKESVRSGKNKRRGHVDNGQSGCCGSHGSSTFGSHMQGYLVSFLLTPLDQKFEEMRSFLTAHILSNLKPLAQFTANDGQSDQSNPR